MYGWAGMGAASDLPQYIWGGAVNCPNPITWAFTPQCWKYSPEAWEQMKNFTIPVTAADIKPPAAVPLAYTKSPTYPGETSAEVIAAATAEQDAVIARAAEENRQRILERVQADPSYIPEPKDKGVPWWLWMVGGLGVFGLVVLSAGGPRRYGR